MTLESAQCIIIPKKLDAQLDDHKSLQNCSRVSNYYDATPELLRAINAYASARRNFCATKMTEGLSIKQLQCVTSSKKPDAQLQEMDIRCYYAIFSLSLMD